jgi:hypothetical protein
MQTTLANGTDLATSTDPTEIYTAMRPDQRTAIGLEFQRLFQLAGDAAAPRFAVHTDGMLTPEEVAALHIYAREHRPELLEQVLRHPVTVASLAWLTSGGDTVAAPAEERSWRTRLRALLRRR